MVKRIEKPEAPSAPIGDPNRIEHPEVNSNAPPDASKPPEDTAPLQRPKEEQQKEPRFSPGTVPHFRAPTEEEMQAKMAAHQMQQAGIAGIGKSDEQLMRGVEEQLTYNAEVPAPYGEAEALHTLAELPAPSAYQLRRYTPEHVRSMYSGNNPGIKKMLALFVDYPRDTPDEHVMFGYGSHRITYGDLKDVFEIK